MAASTQRLPFAELGASRLQGLAAQKNCQNALTDMLTKANGTEKSKHVLASPAKRPHTPVFDDEDFDSENVDPALASSKRSKGPDGKVKPMFTLNTTAANAALTTRSLSGQAVDKPSTPASPLGDKFAFSSLPSGASSMPAGRSPKHKRVGILSKQRTSGSPFRRIDPPRFGASKKPSAGLPFSIDAALSGTLSGYSSPALPKAKAPSVVEPAPKGWFFDIHEDTPEEEAANLMEHSTCILDISSDDEAGPSKRSDDRGKENVPPPDHDAATASRDAGQAGQGIGAAVKARRSVPADAMVDEGQDRAPLGMLPAEDFYANGLDARSVEVVNAEPEAGQDEPTPVQTEIALALEGKENATSDAALRASLAPVQGNPESSAAFIVHEDATTTEAVPSPHS